MAYAGVPTFLRESQEGGPGSGPRKGQGSNWKMGDKREPTPEEYGHGMDVNVKNMAPVAKSAGFKRDPSNDGDYDDAYAHRDGTQVSLEGGGWTHVNKDGDILGEGDEHKSLGKYLSKKYK